MARGRSGVTESERRSSAPSKKSVSGSRGRSRGIGWGELARNNLIVVHRTGLFLLHAVAHDIEYEIHREIGGDRDLNGGELRSLVVEI